MTTVTLADDASLGTSYFFPYREPIRASGGFPIQKAPFGPNRVDMCITCNYAIHMSKMIQLRNVPDALHRSLKARAALSGRSLSDYLIAEIKEIAERPTLEEMRERLHRRKPVNAELDTVRTLREERDAR